MIAFQMRWYKISLDTYGSIVSLKKERATTLEIWATLFIKSWSMPPELPHQHLLAWCFAQIANRLVVFGLLVSLPRLNSLLMAPKVWDLVEGFSLCELCLCLKTLSIPQFAGIASSGFGSTNLHKVECQLSLFISVQPVQPEGLVVFDF